MRDNVDRFDGLAEAHEMHRPGYPEEAFRTMAADHRCAARIAVDEGARLGNSTGSLMAALGQGWAIVAIEPGRDMRRVLSRRFASTPQVHVSDATAEEMLLPAGLAGLVVASTADHWFDRARFFRESARVLAPGGVVAVLRNRRKSHPVIETIDRFIETPSAKTSNLAQRDQGKEPSLRDLAQMPGFAGAHSGTWGWTCNLTERGRTVGRGFRVVGFDDIEECAHSFPPLTSVRCDIAGFGRAMAQTILAWLETGTRPAPVTMTPVTLVPRASSLGG